MSRRIHQAGRGRWISYPIGLGFAFVMVTQHFPLDAFDPLGDTVTLILAALGLLTAFRLPRMRIESSEEGIVIHNPVRVHRLSWSDIRSIEVEPAVQVRKLYLTTHDGRRIAAEGVRAPLENAPFRDDRPALEVRDELESQRQRALHREH